jgi:hypothetical protein
MLNLSIRSLCLKLDSLSSTHIFHHSLLNNPTKFDHPHYQLWHLISSIFFKSLMTETDNILPQEGQVPGQRKHTAGILIFCGKFSDRNISEKSFVRWPLKGLSVTNGCYTWKSYPLVSNKSMFR